jgi:hypothetical protein
MKNGCLSIMVRGAHPTLTTLTLNLELFGEDNWQTIYET